MAIYTVILVVETEPAEKDPINWDWPTLVDTPNAEAIMSLRLADDPTDGQIASLVSCVDLFVEAARKSEIDYWEEEVLPQCEECGEYFPEHSPNCYHIDCDTDDTEVHGCKNAEETEA